jgi:rhamnose utilization protein RhaD (predicted bifunctional aldolase and dehydrogenase)/NAD(P)-dependent dehydrogenase (short-subunit alcohol dehydrogenase family)
MENLYSKKYARAFVEKYADVPAEMALRVYTSRLIGRNNNLVLHGGGNTSVKLVRQNLFGEDVEVIFVKASGYDMADIEPDGFTGLILEPLKKLRRLDQLSDRDMENQMGIHRLSARSPDPSVEALLHVFLPHRFVDHTHADSILLLTHLKNGESLLQEVLGPRAAIIPYARSGLPLAKSVIDRYEQQPDIDAVVIFNHGLFTFADDARTAYENMIAYVDRAEAYIQKCLQDAVLPQPRPGASVPTDIASAQVRCAQTARGLSARPTRDCRLQRFYVDLRTSPEIVAVSLSEYAEEICFSGVLTPDHAIRTKNRMVYIESVPESDEHLGQVFHKGIEEFKQAYHRYIGEHSDGTGNNRNVVDAFPVLFLVAGVGLLAVGTTRTQARIAADIGEHTVRAKLQACVLGTYCPMDESHVFDMEFWQFQQNKIKKDVPLPLQGQSAIVTGAAGAIGYGIADRLAAAGAVVVISDIDEPGLDNAYGLLTEKYDSDRIEKIVFDVTDYAAVQKAFDDISQSIGGLDIIVPNAGIAHVARIEELSPEKLDQVVAVNLKGTFTVIKAAISVFKRQQTGGNIVVISSKNVFDPGAAFGAYSASKAGAHQMSKIAALELAELGVRVNMVNPDAVFGDENVCSKLWEEVGPERMKARGLDPEELKEYYCQRSLLKERVLAEHVGNAVVFFASDLTPTTGAALPVDAGNPATFSR